MPSSGSRLNATAVLAVGSSLAGFACLPGFGGLLGVVLALVARSEIERSEGRERGRALANVGLALGLLNIFSLFLGIAALISWMASQPKASPPPVALPPPIITAPPPPAPTSPRAVTPAPPGHALRERDHRTTAVGKITLVDPGDEPGPLPALLRSELAAAQAARQKLIVWTVTPECSPCNGVAVALPDPALQHALADVRLLRLDVREFAPELDRLGFPLDRVPGFALLGSDLRVVDYVDGGEWDADIAKNIAPVLGAFVRGKYTQRRHQFRAVLRGDEQAL